MSRRPRNLGFSIFLHHSAENSSRIGSRPGPRIDGRSQITRRTRGWPAFEPCLFEPESLFPGKQILCAETKVSKPSREITETPAETELTPNRSANWAANVGWSGNLGAVGMRGGGRSRGRTGLFCRFPGNREKYREKIGGVTNPASVGGAVHAPKSS